MKLYAHLLLYKIILFISYLWLSLSYAAAQAPVPVLVSADDDNKICQGESVTIIATPLPRTTDPKYTYKFYRDGTEITAPSKTDSISGNKYFFTATKNITANQIKVKAKIVASTGTPTESGFSNEITVSIRPLTIPTIRKKATGGWTQLPKDVFSTDDPIILDARYVPDPNNDAEGEPLPGTGTGIFTGEAVKRTGSNEYKFFPSFATPGDNIIFYTYTQDENPNSPPSGCTITVQATITIKADIGVIKGLTPSVDVNCVKNKENPVTLNLANSSIPFNCYFDGTIYTCYSQTITYNLISITGKGISGDLNAGFKFNPLKARTAGDIDSTKVSLTYSITYENFDFWGNSLAKSTTAANTVTEKVDLYTIDELQITNSGQEFEPSSSFCRTESVILTGIPSSIAGQFRIKKPARPDGSIPPVEVRGTPYEIPWKNDATNYPAGEYEITYKYTNPNGCESIDKIVKFTLKEVPPAASITSLIYNYCVGEPIPTLSSPASPGFTTLWRKGDPKATTISGDSYDPEVNNTFANSVNIYVTQYNGTCESTIKTITISVSPKPIANFVFRNVRLGGEDEFTEFEDRTQSNGNTIEKKKWDFGDGDILQEGTGPILPGTHEGRTTGTYNNPKHKFLTPKTYQVTLTLVTSACPDAKTIPVYIFPLRSGFPYIETFENGEGGWLQKSDTLTSWKLTQPTGLVITPDAASPHAWVTSNTENTYNSLENSFVESPFFQLNTSSKLYLSINIKSDTEEGLDGAVLQYVIDNGKTFNDQLLWKVLGKRNEGINWYNTTGIVSNPGGQNTTAPAIGWSGHIYNSTDTSKWVTAKFDLSQVQQEAGDSPVRFRISFSSNADNPPNKTFDGFAFDNFRIGEINRVVLLEHFTNTSQPDFIQENKKIYETVKNNAVAAIQYHTGFPDANDPFNKSNPADPSARALLYGIAESNRTVLDGISFENKAFSVDVWGKNEYSKRILFEAPFKIDIQLTGGENDPLNIKTSIFKNDNLEDFNNPLVVQVAIVEKEVIIGADTFQNVLRKILPDAAGKHIPGPWIATDKARIEVVERTWLPADVAAAPNKFAVIVFVQDENTKEVYQAKQELITVPLPKDPSGGRNGIPTGWDSMQDHTILISPNPASNKVHISFTSIPEEDFILTVFDALGKVITSNKIAKGSSTYVLHTGRYSNGLYLVQMMKAGTTQVIRKKLFIAH
ncbi:T9SS type A sorting domain-containing protein [Rhodocytophaga rosea]|uniref:T9SS type A sorting domain-containing protein n=1 Tax=Rhodocytophaga rosea TaxID=2704465 RepID=A0A6C0GDK5_9BACT|nr:T9SS type A sorting domain-containing protein [Rhodocytophaga rosea]QHT66036.1 T9SS type A sorting domain-containing protein [Rhodocytophaga rosea]